MSSLMKDESIELDLRVRLLLRLNRALTKAGVLPTFEKVCAMPVAKRKATRPPHWVTGPMPAGVGASQQAITGRGGEIAVRIYDPSYGGSRRPLILYMHGGGWVSGGLPTVDHFCAHVAAAAEAAVVSVDYRLAPEFPYPAALDDCYDALCWASEHAQTLRGDPTRMVVMGDSAGGNLAAALCLLARDKGPPIAHQVLLYPGLDLTLGSPSMSRVPDVGLTRKDIETVVRHYLGGADPRDPLVSPLFATDLSGLPPALIITADVDFVRDDGKRYAARLTEDGVPVRHTNYVRMPHGFLSSPRLSRSWSQALAEIAQELERALGSRTSSDGAAAAVKAPQGAAEVLEGQRA